MKTICGTMKVLLIEGLEIATVTLGRESVRNHGSYSEYEKVFNFLRDDKQAHMSLYFTDD